MIGFLDSEEETSMPVGGSLLNAPSGEEMARHCLSLYHSAIALAARIADISYTSRLLEHQLDNALVFLLLMNAHQPRNYTKSYAKFSSWLP